MFTFVDFSGTKSILSETAIRYMPISDKESQIQYMYCKYHTVYLNTAYYEKELLKFTLYN